MASTVAYDSGAPPGPTHSFAARVRRFVRFGLVGMSGAVVNEVALAVFVGGLHANYLLGAVLATQCSTAWNFALVEWWAFADTVNPSGRLRRFGVFWLINNVASLVLRGPILALLTSVFHVNYLISNLISLGVLVLARFFIADSLIWGNKRSPAPTRPVSRDDLLAHFPHDLAEDLGWAVNPVAEAAELVGDAPRAAPTTAPPAPPAPVAGSAPPAPPVGATAPEPPAPRPAATAAPGTAPSLPSDLQGGVPRFGTVRPPLPPGPRA